MKKLIVAEKPSVARAMAFALKEDNIKSKDGYMEGDKYVITALHGHLFEAYDIEEYEKSDNTVWTYDNIPFYPEKFLFHLKRDRKTKKTDEVTKKCFYTLKALVERPDIDEIINFGDADREGEILVRICIRNIPASKGKTFSRIWANDTTPATLKSALISREDEKEYDNLADEGFTRLYEDWLYGINLTRYVTLKAKENGGSFFTFRVGRVLCAIVKAIYDRDMAIKDFVPKDYLAVESKTNIKGLDVTLTSKNEFEPSEMDSAKSLCQEYNTAGGIVTSSEKAKKEIKAPKLFSTTSLQNAANKVFGFSPADTMKYYQGLYERGYLSYPRVNTEYLVTAEKAKIQKIIETVLKTGITDNIVFKDSSAIFNDKYVEAHSALTITDKIPEKFESANEERIYNLVRNRFFAVFCKEPCMVDRSEIKLQVSDEEFTLKGDVLITPGWRKFENVEKNDRELPMLKVGEKIDVNFEPTAKQTHPPAHYTVKTLNDFLETPFKDEKKLGEENNDEDLLKILDGLQIGTGATRAPIIEKCIANKYITLSNKTYTITDIGIYLVESLASLEIDLSKEKTMEMNRQLKQVYRGSLSVEQALEETKSELDHIFSKRYIEITPFLSTGEGEEICNCPKCDGKIVSRTDFYGCSNFKEGCKVTIPKRLWGATVNPKAVKDLVLNGKTSNALTFVSKTGKKYKAVLMMKVSETNGKIMFKNELAPPKVLSVKCPECGGSLIEKNGFYGCENYTNGCTYGFPKKIFGASLSPSSIEQLITDGKTKEAVTCKSKKTGSTYKAVICYSKDEKGEYRFSLEDIGSDYICSCPLCKTGKILKGKKGYFCSGYKDGCSFGLFAKQYGHEITPSQVKNLCEKKKTSGKCKSSKTGKDYNGYLVLNSDNKVEFVFENKKK